MRLRSLQHGVMRDTLIKALSSAQCLYEYIITLFWCVAHLLG